MFDFITLLQNSQTIRNRKLSNLRPREAKSPGRLAQNLSMFERLEMPFKSDKCHIFQMETRNKRYEYEIWGVKLEKAQSVKDICVDHI